jgi:hypothetical protein
MQVRVLPGALRSGETASREPHKLETACSTHASATSCVLGGPSPALIRRRKGVRLPHARHAGVAQRKSRALTRLRSGVRSPPPVHAEIAQLVGGAPLRTETVRVRISLSVHAVVAQLGRRHWFERPDSASSNLADGIMGYPRDQYFDWTCPGCGREMKVSGAQLNARKKWCTTICGEKNRTRVAQQVEAAGSNPACCRFESGLG